MKQPTVEELTNTIVEMAVESWRFRSVFSKAMSKLDAGESSRYIGQFNWFQRKMNQALEAAGLRIVDVEGQVYDPGVAATPMNIEEFDPEDTVFVKQMIEPIIMDETRVIRAGTVILGRYEK